MRLIKARLLTARRIGCEAKATMRNMIFDNIVVRNSHRGVGIHLSHGCDVENVIFSNMVIETSAWPDKFEAPKITPAP